MDERPCSKTTFPFRLALIFAILDWRVKNALMRFKCLTMAIVFPFPPKMDVTRRSVWAFGLEFRFGVRGKRGTKCCQNSRGRAATEPRAEGGQKIDERARGAGEERVKRKVGRNTHSLTHSPSLFLSLSLGGKSNKSKKAEKTLNGKEGTTLQN